MISGGQALSSIDRSLHDARERMTQLQSRIEQLRTQLLELGRAEADDYRELARMRVDELADTDLGHRLDRTRQQVVTLFQQREAAIAQAHERLENARQRQRELQSQRDAAALRVDEAAGSIDAAEAATQSRLDGDPDYRAQRHRAAEEERRAMHADDKATRSEEELEEKGLSYRKDPLFMYLWERGHGLPRYRARGLFRWLDGKVARLIGFEDARANFSRLNEIPQRLRAHAQRLLERAEKEHAKLKALDEAGRTRDGIPSLEKKLAEAQRALDAIDEAIEQGDAEVAMLMQSQADFASGEDEFTRRAIEYLSSELRRQDMLEIRHEALLSPLPDDDLVVARMLDRERSREELEATMQGLREALQQQQRRLSELESLRIDFKRSRYDRAGSIFQDGSLIAMMLSQFLQGMLDRRQLWQVLQQQQRYRPRRSDPTFGSGGFGRGTVWNGGIGDVLGELGRAARGGTRRPGPRGGGGFRTGGGF